MIKENSASNMQQNIILPGKRRKSSNVAEPGGPYAKGSKPDTQRSTWYDLTFTWDLKIQMDESREGRTAFAQELGGGGNGEMLVKWNKASVMGG